MAVKESKSIIYALILLLLLVSISLLFVYVFLVHEETADATRLYERLAKENITPDTILVQSDTGALLPETVTGIYTEYSPVLFDTSESKGLILFFYFSEDFNSQKLDKEITSNVGKIPEDVIVIKVPADDASNISDEFRDLESNFVILCDENLKVSARWEGEVSLDEILAEVKD